MEEETDYWQCPTCGCFFSIEEFDEQRCGACGWPDEEDDIFNDDFDEEEDFYYNEIR